jgi:hypothetical protein
VTYLDARLLKDIVNRGIHPIRCASTCGHKALRGLLLGDLCAETNHLGWALRIWKFTLKQIHEKDYDDWIDVHWFNTKYVSFQDVISDGWCEIIGRRMDEAERKLGISDARGRDSWEYRAGDGWYNSFFAEKFDCNWDEWREECLAMRNELLARQNTERIFRDGQANAVHPSDYFDYWNDYDPSKEDLYFKIDDWD